MEIPKNQVVELSGKEPNKLMPLPAFMRVRGLYLSNNLCLYPANHTGSIIVCKQLRGAL